MIENGGEQPANDTVLPNDAVQPTAAAENTEVTEGENTEGEEGQQTEPEDEEVDYEGAKYRVPKPLKDALLRQADYTRKTQEVAELRKSIEAERETVTKSRESQRTHFEDAAKVFALNTQIGDVDKDLARYANVDWVALAQNPEQYQQHRAYYDTLRDRKQTLAEQRDTAARSWSQKEQEYTEQSTRERGERIAKAQAELPKLIEGWNAELDTKIGQYGLQGGLSKEEMANAALQNPKFAVFLHKAMLYDEQQKTQKKQQQFEQSQQAKPVTRVGANAGSSARKTTDASGDALSDAEWVKREAERVAAKRLPQQRRA
jgi:hypothetical protein